MYVTWMRNLLKRAPLIGVPIIGIFLLARLLWFRKWRALFGWALVAAVSCVYALVPRIKNAQVDRAPAAGRKALYSVTDLGTISGMAGSVATDINNKGQVVGWCGVHGQATHAFLWQDGRMTDLGTPRGNRSKALALNDKTQIVGWSGADENKDCASFLWKNGKASPLGTLPDRSMSVATGINKNGDISGTAFNPWYGQRSKMRGFLLSKGTMTAIHCEGDDANEALALNDKGQVVGYFHHLIDIFDAFIYQNGKACTLNANTSIDSSANSINNRGAVVGASDISRGDSHFHALLWEHGADSRPTDLGSLGGESRAKDINDNNQVVGWSSTTARRPANKRAFLWQKGKMQSLQDCIPTDSGWILSEASAINNRGQIVGTGTIDGKTHAFILTPEQ